MLLTSQTYHGRQRLVHKLCEGLRRGVQNRRTLLEGLLHSCLMLQGNETSMSQCHDSVNGVTCMQSVIIIKNNSNSNSTIIVINNK